MSDYLYGSDVLGADDGEMSDAVRTMVLAEKPLAPARARSLIVFAVDALAEMNFFDRDEETTAWRDDMAQQLAQMDETISHSESPSLPDKATDVLSAAISAVAEMLDEGADIYPQILRVQDRFLQSLGVGIQVLGARTKQTFAVGGDDEAFFSEIVGGPTGWDNTQAYSTGDVVYNDRRYWRAQRDVSPPFMPSLMSGDVPGQSDAWREVSAASAYPGSNVSGAEDVLGELAEVLGMFDIGQAEQRMNALTPVTVSVAQALLKGGQDAINHARELVAKDQLHDGRDKTRDTIYWKLQWHGTTLRTAGAPDAPYAPGDDLKQWVMQAFIESNAADTGAEWVDGAWSRMWEEIAAALAALPKKIVQAIAKLPGQAFEAVTGVPSWAFWVGSAALVGLVGYGAYRILAGPAGGAVVSHYLGGRR